MGFAQNLCDLMQKRNVSSYKLAKDLGVHISTVSNWRGGAAPQVGHAQKVAEYFSITVDELLRTGEARTVREGR